MNISLTLFLIGILGFILNRKNIILMIIAIEIMLLAVTLLVLIMSYAFDDSIGQTFSIYIISVAGAESVIGLSILVAYYRFIATLIISNCLFNNNTLHIVAPCLAFKAGGEATNQVQ
jgi:NADH-ubiquinone oxidoreductase chain 4L